MAVCIRSMTRIHCETANFWTHFIPALMALFFLMSNFSPHPLSFISYSFDWRTFTLLDGVVLAISAFGIMACFSTSSIFHVFSSHNEWAGPMNEFDLMGIMYMNSSLLFGFDYFKFYHDRTVQYGSLIYTVLVGGVSIFTVRSLRDPRAKGFRVLVYIIATLLLTLPGFTSVFLESHVPVDPIGKSLIHYAVFYSLLGGFFYASKYPEKLFPGYFDLFGSSHMCMHVCTAMGVFYLYECIFRTAVTAHNELLL